MKQTFPRKSKFKKSHKGVHYNRISKMNGAYALCQNTIRLKILEGGRITSKQIESIRSTIMKVIKKIGRLHLNCFAFLQISKKPIETRMGKGKGSVDHWVFCAKPGFVICTIQIKTKQLGIFALKLAQDKISLKTKVIVN